MMQNTFRVEKPSSIIFALITTMSLNDWKRLDEQLSKIPTKDSQSYPLKGFRDVIYDMTRQAEKVFAPPPVVEELASDTPITPEIYERAKAAGGKIGLPFASEPANADINT